MATSKEPAADQSRAEWLAEKARSTECSFKVVVQVRDDRVWVGTFYGPDDKTEKIGVYETFPRPDGKTHADCVARAMSKAVKWVPEDFSGDARPVSDW